jgi:hypothetical protein
MMIASQPLLRLWDFGGAPTPPPPKNNNKGKKIRLLSLSSSSFLNSKKPLVKKLQSHILNSFYKAQSQDINSGE